ncbi:RuvB-like protein 1 [Enteropsectra breve]|nr:RuvB-like protein 1 [Enteropsectra breve]
MKAAQLPSKCKCFHPPMKKEHPGESQPRQSKKAKVASKENESLETSKIGEKELLEEMIGSTLHRDVIKNNTEALEALDEFIRNQDMKMVLISSQDTSQNKLFGSILWDKIQKRGVRASSLGITDGLSLVRQAVLLQCDSSVAAWEGEVRDIKMYRDANGDVNEIEMDLRTAKATKKVYLDKFMRREVSTINIGDVVYIEPSAGLIKRLGRSETRVNEYDLEADKYIPLAKGSVDQLKDRRTVISKYDVDYAFNEYKAGITSFTRDAVDSFIADSGTNMKIEYLDSFLMIEDLEYLGARQLATIISEIKRSPATKLVLVGDSSKICSQSILREIVQIQINAAESKIDILRAYSSKLSDENYLCAVEEYLGQAPLETLKNVICLSENADEFRDLIQSQIVISN